MAGPAITPLQPGPAPRPFRRTRCAIGWFVPAAVAGWFRWAEHRAHMFGAQPFRLLLACPRVHLFMHHGRHGGHGHHGAADDRRSGS